MNDKVDPDTNPEDDTGDKTEEEPLPANVAEDETPPPTGGDENPIPPPGGSDPG